MLLVKRHLLTCLVAIIIAAMTMSCSATPQRTTGAAAAAGSAAQSAAATTQAPVATTKTTASRPAGWDNASHSNDADPNYAVVFPQDKVNQITITLSPENWAAMQADMTKLFGAQGTGAALGGRGDDPAGGQPQGEGMPLPPADMQPPQGGMRPPQGGMPPGEGGFPGGGRGPGGGGFGRNPDLTPTNPTWIEATVAFDGETWTHVGVRFKGNSTLTRAWRSGSAKLPLKLDFDQFEDTYSEIANQRFYGFKQLSLGNNLSDATYLRDALSYDIMEAAGLVTPETAFYELLLDTGQGPVSLGLYTAVEVVDDTVVERHFGDADGNIYEGDGAAASFAAGTDGQIKSSFQKENNTAAADWTDIQELYDVLHSTLRTSDAAAWRAKLEAVFDVDAFLEWLALNTTIQDWDAYGAMSHNYYLYHDPTTSRLTWISWDHNEAMGASGRGDTSLNKASVGQNWPLIRFLLDDPVYQAKYTSFLRAALTDAFVPAQLTKKIDSWSVLIRPYAAKEGQAQAFESAIGQLKTLLTQRAAAVETYLAGQK